MAIEMVDPGGEYYFSIGVNGGGIWNQTSGATLVSSAPAGRLTQYGIQLGNNSFVEKQLSALGERYIAGAYFVPVGPLSANALLIQAYDGSSLQCDLRIDAGGHLFFTRNGTTIGSASSLFFSAGTGWHYIEVHITINGSTGVASAWVDGVNWLTQTGLNTQATGNASFNRIRWSNSISAANNAYWKDMYSIDPSTGVNTTRLGDVQIGVFYPTGAGTNQQFSNTGGASQTASVQDGTSHTGTWPDGDTSYISDSTSGHISDFAHQTVGAGTVYAVVHTAYVRSDAGAASFEHFCKSGGTSHTSGSVAANGSYNYYWDFLEVDPNTSAQWTVSNLNSATFGLAIP